MKKQSRSTKRSALKTKTTGLKTVGRMRKRGPNSSRSKHVSVLIGKSKRPVAGVAREALVVFRGGVHAALQRLSRERVAVMVKTERGPVIGVPKMKNGVVTIASGSGVTGRRRRSTIKQ